MKRRIKIFINNGFFFRNRDSRFLNDRRFLNDSRFLTNNCTSS